MAAPPPHTLTVLSGAGALKASLFGLPREILVGYRCATDAELNLFFKEIGFREVLFPRLRIFFDEEIPRAVVMATWAQAKQELQQHVHAQSSRWNFERELTS
eukprot:m51a1_g8464 hypothetical protein (102) ;mRNA; r:439313-439859